MNLQVFHQLGYQNQWNFHSLAVDALGDGVILAPRHIARSTIEQMNPAELRDYIFDPQFFLPRTPKGQLATYDFFPDVVADGFKTSEYAIDDSEQSHATRSAVACVDFQSRNDFRYLVIPTRHVTGAPSDFIEHQQRLFVDPFLTAVAEQDTSKPVLLQLILNNLMLREQDYVADLLNWVTSFDQLSGVYIIFDTNRTSKQIADPELLYAALRLVHALGQNGLDVVIGYTNTEALLFSIAAPKIVTIGCYENTRIFNIRTFEDEEKPGRQGPVPRIYVSKLLQWVDHRYVNAISRALPDSLSFFDQNQYQAEMFQPSFNWHFTKPELYKHAMLEFSKQLRHAGEAAGRDRYLAVKEMINVARGWYARIAHAGVELDSDSDGSHLPAWLTAANMFANDLGWR